MRRKLTALLVCCCILGAGADEGWWTSGARPTYSLKQQDDGFYSFWKGEQALWSGSSPTVWTGALISADGTKVVAWSGTGRVERVGARRWTAVLPQRPEAGWLTDQVACIRTAGWALHALNLTSGQRAPLHVGRALAHPACPPLLAAELGAAHAVRLSPAKLRKVDKDQVGWAAYEARWGRPGRLRALVAQGVGQDWAALLPGASLAEVLKHESPDYALVARLCSDRLWGQARLSGGVKAERLLCFGGDRAAQERVLKRCLSSPNAADASALTLSRSPLAPQLTPLLRSEDRGSLEVALEYFLDHPTREALPLLVGHKDDPTYGPSVQRLLRSHAPTQPAANVPRQLAVIHSGPCEELVFTSPVEVRKQAGVTDARPYLWNVRGEGLRRFPRPGLRFAFAATQDIAVLHDSERSRVALLQPGTLRWHQCPKGVESVRLGSHCPVCRPGRRWAGELARRPRDERQVALGSFGVAATFGQVLPETR